MYFLQMTCSIEHTEEEDNDKGGGREEVSNEQLVKGALFVYNNALLCNACTVYAMYEVCIRKYRDCQKKTLVCMYQDLGGY